MTMVHESEIRKKLVESWEDRLLTIRWAVSNGLPLFPMKTFPSGPEDEDIDKGKLGKRPAVSEWQKTLPFPTDINLDEVVAWAQAQNVGLVTGTPSGVVAIDFDPRNGVDPDEFRRWPETATVLTPNGGQHLYYRSPHEEVLRELKSPGEGIDLQGHGRCVGIAGNVSCYGPGVYSWADGLRPDQVRVAELPVHMLNTNPRPSRVVSMPSSGSAGASTFGQAATERIYEELRGAAPGSRNDAAFHAGQQLGALDRDGHLDGQEAMVAAVQILAEAGLPVSESREALMNGFRSGHAHGAPTPPRLPECNDRGGAEVFVELHRGTVYVVEGGKEFIVREDGRWRRREPEALLSRCDEVADRFAALSRQVRRSSAGEDEGDDRTTARAKSLYRHAKKLGNVQNQRNLIRKVASTPSIQVLRSAIDGDPWLITVEGGVVDLRDDPMVLRREPESAFCTKESGIRFDPNADCPGIMAQLFWSMEEDQDRYNLLLDLLATCLIGLVPDRRFFVLHGPPCTGKSIVVELMMALLGEYACNLEPEALSARGRGLDDKAKAMLPLVGARLALCSELPGNGIFDAALLKKWMGGGEMTARSLYANTFTFRPQATFIIETNHRLQFKPADEGVNSRLVEVPFNRRFPGPGELGHRSREEVLDSLLPELPGFFNLLVAHLRSWLARGSQFSVSEASIRATQEAIQETNPVASFVEECCELKPGVRVASNALYAAYTKWAKDTGRTPIGETNFSKSIRALEGVAETRFWDDGRQVRGHSGICLR